MIGRIVTLAVGCGFAAVLTALWMSDRKAVEHADAPVISNPMGALLEREAQTAPEARHRSNRSQAAEPDGDSKAGALVDSSLRLTSRRWNDCAGEPAFARFAEWVGRYSTATDDTQRMQLEAEGIPLARRRRDELSDLIRSDPKRAVGLAVPEAARLMLPLSVKGLIEEQVDGRGDFLVSGVTPEPGAPTPQPIRRQVVLGDRTYEAFVYGRRSWQPTRFEIPLHGIALGGRLAVDEDPVRLLDSAESAALTLAAAGFECPACGRSITTGDQAVAGDDGAGRRMLCSVAHAEEYNRQLIVEEDGQGGGGAEGERTVELASKLGIKRLVLIRVDFSDLAGAPFSDSTGTNLISGLHEFYYENSYGKAGFKLAGAGSDTTKTLRMPQTAAYYGANDASILRKDARSAATAAGYVLSRYDYDLICFGAVPGFGWAGLGYIGAPGAWIRDSFDVGVSAHELGHNFGLFHANFWDTAGESVIGAGASVEYGDSFDTMGSATGGKRHFNTRYKNYLGWLTSVYVRTVSANGTYRIFAHDATNNTELRALKIVKNRDTNYWIEFRQRFTNNMWMMNGAGLRWAGNENNATLLLDSTPGSIEGKNDSAIVIGRTFSDWQSQIHITPIGKAGTTPESLEVVVNRGEFPGNRPPALQVSTAATNLAAGVKASFQAVATDLDRDALAYCWDFGDGSLGTNSAEIVKSWASTGEYVVRCTVSDMKGGVGSDSVVVRVGNPSTLSLSGRVTRDGLPVEGVRIYVSNTKQAYTDSDGAYTMTGLTRGSYTVRASREGYFFTHAGFDNPLDFTSSQAGLDFEAVQRDDLEVFPIVAEGAVWKYLDNGSNQGSTWRASGFNDSTWDEGPARLGYGDDDIVTEVSFGTDPDNKHITTYLRRVFQVEDPQRFATVTLGLLRDDGAVVYLNGKEVFRSNMPAGSIGYRTLASSVVGGGDESTFFETEIDPASLANGDNTLAVELHQAEVDSSDIGFDLRLTGFSVRQSAPPQLSWELAADGLRLLWAETAGEFNLYAAESLDAGAGWHPVDATPSVAGGLMVVVLPPPATNQFYRLSRP